MPITHFQYINNRRYVAGLYWSITTIATVGFGDISAHTTLERLYCIIMMAFGIAIYSLNLTKLSSILMREDEKNKEFNEQLEWLETLEDKYQISTDLAMRVKKSLKFHHSKIAYDPSKFLHILPKHLYCELAISIYKDIISFIPFFRNRSKEFIANLIPFLINIRLLKNDYLCKEGSEVTEIYFLFDGLIGALHESSIENDEIALPYYIIEKGSIYGEFSKDMMSKQFHVFNLIALKDSELLVLKLGVSFYIGLFHDIRVL
jgi:voltage-gated potassium channel